MYFSLTRRTVYGVLYLSSIHSSCLFLKRMSQSRKISDHFGVAHNVTIYRQWTHLFNFYLTFPFWVFDEMNIIIKNWFTLHVVSFWVMRFGMCTNIFIWIFHVMCHFTIFITWTTQPSFTYLALEKWKFRWMINANYCQRSNYSLLRKSFLTACDLLLKLNW